MFTMETLILWSTFVIYSLHEMHSGKNWKTFEISVNLARVVVRYLPLIALLDPTLIAEDDVMYSATSNRLLLIIENCTNKKTCVMSERLQCCNDFMVVYDNLWNKHQWLFIPTFGIICVNGVKLIASSPHVDSTWSANSGTKLVVLKFKYVCIEWEYVQLRMTWLACPVSKYYLSTPPNSSFILFEKKRSTVFAHL